MRRPTQFAHQPGVIHGWCLSQDEVWVDIEGQEHKLLEMPLDYLQNLQVWLLENKNRVYRAYQKELSLQLQEAQILKDQTLINELQTEQASARSAAWISDSPLYQAVQKNRMRRIQEKQSGQLPLFP